MIVHRPALDLYFIPLCWRDFLPLSFPRHDSTPGVTVRVCALSVYPEASSLSTAGTPPEQFSSHIFERGYAYGVEPLSPPWGSSSFWLSRSIPTRRLPLYGRAPPPRPSRGRGPACHLVSTQGRQPRLHLRSTCVHPRSPEASLRRDRKPARRPLHVALCDRYRRLLSPLQVAPFDRLKFPLRSPIYRGIRTPNAR